MVLERKPFARTRLDEEREQDEGMVISVRLNDEEWAMLKEGMEILDIPADSRALKVLARIGWNVIQNTLGRETATFLFKKERARKDQVKP